MKIKILDTSISNALSTYRGGGRFIQILKENISDKVQFVDSLDRIHANDTLFIPSWSPLDTQTPQRRVAKKQIVAIFDTIPLKYPDAFPLGLRGKLTVAKNKGALKNFDTIITISRTAAKDIEQYLHIPPEKIQIVYPTTSKIFFKKGSRRTLSSEDYSIPNSPYCVYVGDVNWNKNLLNMARAVKRADLTCVVIGKPFSDENRYKALNSNSIHAELREFQEFSKEVAHDDRFIFTGYMPDEDLIVFLNNAVCNLFVSRDEGFGLPYLEAATQKCPSVVSNIPIFNEIVDDAALFAAAEDPQSIAEKLVRLRDDSKLRNEYASKAFKRSAEFSPSIFTKNILNVLDLE